MTERHAMLVIARAVYDAVEIPGCERFVVAKGAGQQAAMDWWARQGLGTAAVLLEQDRAAWALRLAEWDAGTDMTFGKDRVEPAGPRVDVARFRFPDGTQRVVPLSAAEDYVAQVFRAANPPPTAESQFAAWWRTIKITELQTWTGQLFKGGESLPVDLGVPETQSGYPIGEVLGCLDKLSAEGWRIVHVSEDRSLRVTPDGSSEGRLVTVRYLLSSAS
jgi:hypothetical protein